MGFQYTGFADEAGKRLADQIAAVRAAGWRDIELRAVGPRNVCDLNRDEWASTWAALQESGIGVPCFGGQIANWARPISGAFEADVEELRRAAPYMRECGARILRIMSYPNDKDAPLPEADWKREAGRRLRELARMAEDENVILGHENCSGYGGLGPRQFLELVEAVDSPAFRLIFDTGNNTLHDRNREATWIYYEACRDQIVHVHIKACKPDADGNMKTCYPDEDPVQARILGDLKARGYDGWLSIEPHMAAVVHEHKEAEDAEAARRIWVEYARRLEALVAGL